VLVGVPLGIAGALALTRFLASLFYAVKPNDPVALVTGALLLTGVALRLLRPRTTCNNDRSLAGAAE
jgi:hypothetical protein